MGFNFRKRINLGGGVKLNIGKKGIGLSAGVKGARVSINRRGVRATTSIPGTGISYSKQLSSKSRKTVADKVQGDQRKKGNPIVGLILIAIIIYVIYSILR